MMELLIVGFGPVMGSKYSECIRRAVLQHDLSRYHVIDRESQQEQVEARLAELSVKPSTRTYIPEDVLRNGPDAGIQWLIDEGIFTKSEVKKKIVITTEPQSHGAYIKRALEKRFDVLVSKPLVLPMKEGVLDHEALMPSVHKIVDKSMEAGVNTAVLCLGRLHEVYEQKLRQPVALMMRHLGQPITSVHVKTASGVWNLPSEFAQRENHPYKYGYGMLMHGAYHYIDILARLLLLNKNFYPKEDFDLALQGFTAGPLDQQVRSPRLEVNTTGYRPEFSKLQEGLPYGETDIVASYAMKFRSTGQVLCLGTIALEQTTPGMRSWGPLPKIPYNINGRLHCTDIDVRLGPTFSIAANVTKRPIQPCGDGTDVRCENRATITTRSNSELAGTKDSYRQEDYNRSWNNSYSSAAEADIFQRWLRDEPTDSDFSSHVPSCAILDALLRISAGDCPGGTKIDFNYPAPGWPDTPKCDPWYSHICTKLMHRVSVVVPSFNNGVYLRDCVSSICENSAGVEVEVIIVDDGSTDETSIRVISELEKLKGPHLKIFHHEKNLGVQVARNTGLTAATGTFVVCVDGDDRLLPIPGHPTFLCQAARMLAADPNIAFVHTLVEMFGGFSGLTISSYPLREEMVVCKHHVPTAIVYRRDEISNGLRYIENVPKWQDWAFGVHLLALRWRRHKISEIGFVEGPGYGYRIHDAPSRISRTQTSEYDATKPVVELLQDYFESKLPHVQKDTEALTKTVVASKPSPLKDLLSVASLNLARALEMAQDRKYKLDSAYVDRLGIP